MRGTLSCLHVLEGQHHEWKKEKIMKFKIWVLPLAFLVALTLSAGSALAQRDAATPGPPMQRYSPGQSVTAKAVLPDASGSAKSQLKTKSNASPDATDTCSYTFSTGSGYTYLQFCVTVNGNITEFQSPSGIEQLSPGGSNAFEGYGICDVTNANTAYWDYAGDGDSGNWNAPTTLSQTATSVKIERSTSDGVWMLTQTFTLVPGPNPYAKITMELKNTSGETRRVLLLRYANAVPNTGSPFAENYSGTDESAWGWGARYGLILQDVGIPAPIFDWFRTAFAISTLDGPAPCNSEANYEANIIDGVGSVVNEVTFPGLFKNQSVTVNQRYMQF
jgi:hypothetical protein